MGQCLAKPGVQDGTSVGKAQVYAPSAASVPTETKEDGPVKPVVNSGAARPKPDQPVQRFSEEIPNTAEGEPHKVHLMGPPIPPCEKDRLTTLHALSMPGGVEAPPDPELQTILKLVKSVFDAPAALVALFDDRRIFVSDSDAEGAISFHRGDVPWRNSFCAWTLASQVDQLMVVEDATKDARFADNAFVTGPPGVRHYCGAPLVASNGHRLGSLCFIDTKARTLHAAQAAILGNMAEMVTRHIEKDIALQMRTAQNDALQSAYGQMRRAMDAFEHCVVLLDTSTPGWKMLYANEAFARVTGVDRSAVTDRTLADVFELEASFNSSHNSSSTSKSSVRRSMEQGRAGRETAPLPGTAHEQAVAAGKELTIEGLIVKAQIIASFGREEAPPCSGGSNNSKSRMPGPGSNNSSAKVRLVAKLRPASAAAIDEAAIGVGVPAFLQGGMRMSDSDAPAAGRTLFFMTLETVEQARKALFASRTVGAAVQLGSQATSASGMGMGLRHAEELVEGLELGTLLGRGGFGSVFRGTWFGTPVAVKVVDQDVRALRAGDTPMEAVLGAELRHPHIVSTLKYVVIHPETPRPSNGLAEVAEEDGNESSDKINSQSTTTDSNAAEQQGGGAWAIINHKPAGQQGHLMQVDSPRPNHDLGANMKEAPGRDAPASLVDQRRAESDVTPLNNLMVHDVHQTSNNGQFAAEVYGTRIYSDPHQYTTTPLLTGNQESAEDPLFAQTVLLMEFCDKGCLQDAVERGWLRDVPSSKRGQPNMAAITETAFEIASALNYLHSHGVVHGDLSAFNVLLTSTGAGIGSSSRGWMAKISDFGLSRALEAALQVQTNTYGTITHQPPETLADGCVSRETDIFSFGVLLWQMYTGTRPWAGLTHGQIIVTVASKAKRLVFPQETPEAFASLANACMSYDPTERPPMSDVLKVLKDMKSLYCRY